MPVPLELLALLPLALAAGLDLYLTLAFLSVSPHLGWNPAPGDLSLMDTPAVAIMAVCLYAVELWVERYPGAALFWNAGHTVVRPLAAALLALLLLQEVGIGLTWTGVGVATLVALGAHTVRTGWDLILWLGQTRARVRLLASLATDVIVLALLSLLLDQPSTAALLALAILVLGGLAMGPYLEGGIFAHRLAWGRTWGTVSPVRWRSPAAFPRWIRQLLEGDDLAPGGGLRGSPAGGLWLPGERIFRTGWVVVRGGSPLFLYRRRGRGTEVDLSAATPHAVVREALHNRVDLTCAHGSPCALFFSKDGPRPEGLRAEFLV